MRNWVISAAAALAMGIAMTAPAQANLLTNPGFETGTFAGWATSGTTGISVCAITVVGCAPSGGTYFATINNVAGVDANGSIIQTVILPGAGSYTFGAYVSYGTNNASGNFDQGQISFTVQISGGPSVTLGGDPNALNGQFVIPGSSGYSFTNWFLLSGILNYAGPGSASAIFNINVQNYTAGKYLVLQVDNAFVEGGNVPEPATLGLVGSGLIALGLRLRRRRKA